MLNALRRGSKGILAKVLIALLVLSFAVWGISDFVNQIDPTEVARAGDTPVSTNEYSRYYQRLSTSVAQQMGTGVTPQQAQALGLPNQALSALLTDAFQIDAAHALGLDLGDEALATRIRSAPVFAGPDGTFDSFTFDRIMAENRYSESEFIEVERAAAAQEMLIGALLGGLEAPEPYLEAFNRYVNQERSIVWFTIDEATLPPIPDPSDDDLRAYYEDNTAEFRAPEYRAVSIVSLSAEAIADPAAVSDAAVRAAYEGEGTYGEPERRRVQQVVLDDGELAERAAAALNDGAAFEAILTELDRRFADVDLGLVERSDIVDETVREAAFSLEAPGAVAVDGRFGPVLVRVAAIEEAARQPFEAVAEEIRRDLAIEDARGEVRSLIDSVEDAVAGGARVDEVAERFGLPLTTIAAVTREGLTPDGERAEIAAPALAEAFSAAEGDDAVPVRDGEATRWVQLDGVTETADRPYEEVENAVLLAWTAAQKASLVDDAATAAEQALSEGQSVEEVAESGGGTLARPAAFSRAAPPADLPQAVVNAAFEGGEGHQAVVNLEDGRRAVVVVESVSEPVFFAEAADVQNVRNTLDDALAGTLRTDFVNAWQNEVGATLNQPVLDQVVGLGDGQIN